MYRKILALALAFGISTLALAAGSVNINTATAEEISEALNGIGPAKAEAIVEYREQNGPFQHLDELVNVKGIGMRTVDQNRDVVEFGDDV